MNERASEIQNTLLYHDLVTILVHFGIFWCILVNIMHNPMSPPLIALIPIPFQVSIWSRNGYQSLGQIWNALFCHAILVHFCASWCILMHLDALSNSYPLSGVHLFQKWITLVTKEKLETLCCHGIMTTLVNFGAFCCILLDLMHNLMTPPWLVLTAIPFQVPIYSRNRSYWSLRTNSKKFCSVMLCWPHWFILVHFRELNGT